MSNIYCTGCGTKNVLGSKFCFNCGNQIGSTALMSNKTQSKPTLSKRNIEYDEDYPEEQIRDALEANPSARFLKRFN